MLRLKMRTRKQELPQVYVADMREELKHGNRSILSDRLEELMQDRLDKKEQMMLFLNRRGYAGFVSCRACGYVVNVLTVMCLCRYTEVVRWSVITVAMRHRPFAIVHLAVQRISVVSGQEHSRLKK